MKLFSSWACEESQRSEVKAMRSELTLDISKAGPKHTQLMTSDQTRLPYDPGCGEVRKEQGDVRNELHRENGELRKDRQIIEAHRRCNFSKFAHRILTQELSEKQSASDDLRKDRRG